MSEGTVDTSEDRKSQRKRRTVLLRERAARRREHKRLGWSKRDFEKYFEDDDEWVKNKMKMEEIYRRGYLAAWRLLGVDLDDQDTYENDSLEKQVDKQNDRIRAAEHLLGGLLEAGLAEPLPEVSARALSKYEAGDSAAIAAYIEAVLAKLILFRQEQPQQVKVAYVTNSRQVVVEYELPPIGVVPKAKSYRYVKKTDDVKETARPASQIKALYAGLIAQLTLLCLAKIFEADTARHIDVAVFNGVVDTRDPRSGRPIRPCLITVRVTRDVFEELDLNHVDPAACLKYLSAGVSTSPTELVPVRPVLEFSMVDPRFVAETDAVSSLDDHLLTGPDHGGHQGGGPDHLRRTGRQVQLRAGLGAGRHRLPHEPAAAEAAAGASVRDRHPGAVLPAVRVDFHRRGAAGR